MKVNTYAVKLITYLNVEIQKLEVIYNINTVRDLQLNSLDSKGNYIARSNNTKIRNWYTGH